MNHSSVAAPPQRTLVLGGARSGKSRTAERLLATVPTVRYIGTGPLAGDNDAEWHERVALHRARRPASWFTTETIELADLLRTHSPDQPPLLIDCLTLWLARVMDDGSVWTADTSAADAELRALVDTLVAAWRNTRGRVVAVSNEVGSGVVPEYASGRRFRDELGTLNARLAAECDEVLVVEAGIARSLLTGRPAVTRADRSEY